MNLKNADLLPAAAAAAITMKIIFHLEKYYQFNGFHEYKFTSKAEVFRALRFLNGTLKC